MARDFNGTSDRIDWANVFDVTSQPITVSAWINVDDLDVNRYIFHVNNSTGGYGSLLTIIDTDLTPGRLLWLKASAAGGSSDTFRTSSTLLTIGPWYHVLATDSGGLTASNINLYINGTEVSYYNTNNGADQKTTNGTWSIGGRTVDDNRNTDGRIAEVGVWNRVLTAGEITSLAKGFSPIFYKKLLKFYCPITGNATLEPNLVGARATTHDGTTKASHPRIIYPRGMS